MVPEMREAFNREYTPEKYQQLLDLLKAKGGVYPQFRLSESPIFLNADFKKELHAVAEDIIAQTLNLSPEILSSAVPASHFVPGEEGKPHFFTIDFGICENDGRIVPQLIELQAFPSLYAFQQELQDGYREVYATVKDCQSAHTREDYYQLLRETIISDCEPREVVLLEIEPHHQKTNIDFYLTAKELGISIVCLSEVVHHDGRLYYQKDGERIRIRRIYNRVIFDELDQKKGFVPGFDFKTELDVEWVTHPNWFYKISKYVLPLLTSSAVPATYYLNNYPADIDLKDYVLKPLYSFAGSGVILNPTRSDIDNIQDKKNYILQRKVQYAPLFRDINGGHARAEIRLLYVWPENHDRPILMEHLVRMTKAAMVNVDFNKKGEIWIGGSTAFFV